MKTFALLATLFALPAFAGNEYADKLDQDLGGAQKLLDEGHANAHFPQCFPGQNVEDISHRIADLRAKFAADAKDFMAGEASWKNLLGGNSDSVDSEFVCHAPERMSQTVNAFDISMTRAEATFKGYCDEARAIVKTLDDSTTGHFITRLSSNCRESARSENGARKLLLDAAAQACEHFFMNVSYTQDSAHNARKAFERGCEGLKEDEHDHEVELEHKSDRHQRYMDCYNAHGQVGWSCGDEN